MIKSNICQWLWLPLLLGSACAEQQEVIENNQPVNVTFEMQTPLAANSSGAQGELAVMIFEKSENKFSKYTPQKGAETEWIQSNSFRKSILLPVNTYRFLLAKGFSNESSTEMNTFVEDEATGEEAKESTYARNYYFRHPVVKGGANEVLANCKTKLLVDVNKEADNASQTEYDLSSLNKLEVSRKITHLQGLLCFIVRRATKDKNGYIPIDDERDASENALRKIERINLSIENASSRCYLVNDGLKFGNPLSYSCSLEKDRGDYQFGEFNPDEFIKKFSSDTGIREKDYKELRGSAYCEGPLLFPAPDDPNGGKIKITIHIDYIEPLVTKTLSQTIELKRNQVHLFTLWLLNENINVSVDTELELTKLKFSDKVSGDDGFWN